MESGYPFAKHPFLNHLSRCVAATVTAPHQHLEHWCRCEKRCLLVHDNVVVIERSFKVHERPLGRISPPVGVVHEVGGRCSSSNPENPLSTPPTSCRDPAQVIVNASAVMAVQPFRIGCVRDGGHGGAHHNVASSSLEQCDSPLFGYRPCFVLGSKTGLKHTIRPPLFFNK